MPILHSRALAGNLAGLACMLLWATNFPLIAILLETWHPLLIVPVRLGVAAVTVTLLALILGQGRQLIAIPIGDLARIGGLALSASIICMVWAQVFADPVSAAVVFSAMPLISALMGLASGSERITWRIGAGVGLAIAGGIVTNLASSESGPVRDFGDALIGAILLVVGCVLYIWHSRALVIRFARVPDIAKSAAIMIAATISTLTIACITIGLGLAPADYDLAPRNLAILAALGIFTIGGSTVLWFVTGRLVGVTIAAMHHNLVPFYVILMSALGGAGIQLDHVLGASLVILGAIIAQYPAAAKGAPTVAH